MLIWQPLLFNSLAKLRQTQIIKRLTEQLKDKLGRIYDHNTLNSLLIRLVEILNDSKPDLDRNDRLEKEIKIKLKLEKQGDVDEAYHFCVTRDNHNNLFKSIVILSASLIEILFKDYMYNVLIKRTNIDSADKIMDDLLLNKPLNEHINYLNVFFKNGLRDEMDQIEKGFYDKWQSLIKDRNKLIHRNNIYVSSERVKNIIYLAINSVHVFTKLNNHLISGIAGDSEEP